MNHSSAALSSRLTGERPLPPNLSSYSLAWLWCLDVFFSPGLVSECADLMADKSTRPVSCMVVLKNWFLEPPSLLLRFDLGSFAVEEGLEWLASSISRRSSMSLGAAPAASRGRCPLPGRAFSSEKPGLFWLATFILRPLWLTAESLI